MAKAFEIDFAYPLVGFTRTEGMLVFDDLFALTHSSWFYVTNGTLIGMELIDNGLRRWVVRAIHPLTPPPIRRWWQIFPARSSVEFDLELEEIAPTSLKNLKRLVTNAVDIESPDDRKAIWKASTLAEMYDGLYWQGSGLL
jgi:hypothetical protein